MPIKESKIVYVYDYKIKYIATYKSITEASTKLRMPRSTILTALDAKVLDYENKICKAKRLYCKHLDTYLIFRTTSVPKRD